MWATYFCKVPDITAHTVLSQPLNSGTIAKEKKHRTYVNE